MCSGPDASLARNHCPSRTHSEYDASDCTELLQSSTPDDQIDSEIEYNEHFGLSGVQTPWITGPGMAALKATVGQKGSRTCSELPELQGLQTLIAVSDASHVKHENGTSDGAVHIQGFKDTDLSMPVWTLAFRIHGNPSSSTVCEGEACDAVIDIALKHDIKETHHVMDNKSVPFIVNKGYDKKRTKKMDRLAFTAKEQFLWRTIQQKSGILLAEKKQYHLHWIAGHMDDPEKKAINRRKTQKKHTSRQTHAT